MSEFWESKMWDGLDEELMAEVNSRVGPSIRISPRKIVASKAAKLSGTVARFHEIKGFGFIQPDDDSRDDVFVHVKDLRKTGIEELYRGQRIKYVTRMDRNGNPYAVDVEVSA